MITSALPRERPKGQSKRSRCDSGNGGWSDAKTVPGAQKGRQSPRLGVKETVSGRNAAPPTPWVWPARSRLDSELMAMNYEISCYFFILT